MGQAPLLCVIAPYRPRPGKGEGEPERFVAYMSRWLPRVAGATNFSLWIVVQVRILSFPFQIEKNAESKIRIRFLVQGFKGSRS
jgi:hypothetical protein